VSTNKKTLDKCSSLKLFSNSDLQFCCVFLTGGIQEFQNPEPQVSYGQNEDWIKIILHVLHCLITRAILDRPYAQKSTITFVIFDDALLRHLTTSVLWQSFFLLVAHCKSNPLIFPHDLIFQTLSTVVEQTLLLAMICQL